MVKLLKQNGWTLDRIDGSHHVMTKEGIPNTLSIPVHGKSDLKKGLEVALLKKAGLR